MTIRDGLKFGLGYFIAGGIILYTEEVIVEKNPKYTNPLKRIAAAIKGEEFIEPKKKTPPTKNKIGFTIE